VLEWVRAERLDTAVIMTTAFGSESVAIDALRRGADDYLRKPFEPEEFRAVVDRTASRLFLRRQNRALRKRLDAELRHAAEIQAGLLPDAPPALPGYEIAARCRPARAVGGDFYDWQLRPDGALSLTLGDVMGKGMPAALLMTTVRAALRSVAAERGPGESVRAVERALGDDLDRSRSFVTLFHARLAPESGELSYVDAGHGLTAIHRADGQSEALAERGLPLGIGAEDVAEGWVTLAPGDTLLIYSDGLLDAHPDRNVTAEASLRLIREAASVNDAADRLVAEATGAEPAEDDLTFIIIHRRARTGA
jgi:serine phosphatase RsbU (regulator of sigma subunit)